MSLPTRRFSELKAMTVCGNETAEFLTWWEALLGTIGIMLEEAKCNCDPNVVLRMGEQQTHAEVRHFELCPAMAGGKEWQATPRLLDTKGGSA